MHSTQKEKPVFCLAQFEFCLSAASISKSQGARYLSMMNVHRFDSHVADFVSTRFLLVRVAIMAKNSSTACI